MKRLTDPTFRYTKSVDTDIRRLFRKVRQEQRAHKEELDRKLVRIVQKVRA